MVRFVPTHSFRPEKRSEDVETIKKIFLCFKTVRIRNYEQY